MRTQVTHVLARNYDEKILPHVEHIRGATRLSKYLRKLYLLNRCTREGSRYSATVNDVTFSCAYLNDMRYLYMESEVTDEISRLIKRDDIQTFFDIGAYHGYYASLASQRTEVTAFEQSRKNAKISKENAPEADIIRKAVWSKEKEVNISEKGGSTLQINDGVYPDTTTTLDHYKGKQPDLIKIDVEGAEFHVLQGAEQILDEYQPVCILEIHHGRIMDGTEQDLYDIFKSYGYSTEEISERGKETHIKASP